MLKNKKSSNQILEYFTLFLIALLIHFQYFWLTITAVMPPRNLFNNSIKNKQTWVGILTDTFKIIIYFLVLFIFFLSKSFLSILLLNFHIHWSKYKQVPILCFKSFSIYTLYFLLFFLVFALYWQNNMLILGSITLFILFVLFFFISYCISIFVRVFQLKKKK